MREALSELEHDALAELLNIGLGRAASALAGMSGQGIEIYRPEIQVFDPGTPGPSGVFAESTTLVQSFHGGLEGELMLSYPDLGAVALVRALIPKSLERASEFVVQDDILREVSNVVNYALISALADAFGTRVDLGSLQPLADVDLQERETAVLRISGGFELEDYILSASFVLRQDEQSYAELRAYLGAYVRQVLGASA